jgi:hypothetical protein
MKPKEVAEAYLKKAVIVVLFFWLLFLALTAIVLWHKGDKTIADYGQLGDTFGALNALFTGLALAGLTYTAFLQRQEIQAQERDSQENKRALQREARSQFLAARLNATVALLQACEARINVTRNDYHILQAERAREVLKLKQRISILLCEAHIDINIQLSRTEIEREAIRRYLCQFFSELSSFFLRLRPGTDPAARVATNAIIGGADHEVRVLQSQISDDYPLTAKLLDQFIDQTASLQIKSYEDIASWFRTYVDIIKSGH